MNNASDQTFVIRFDIFWPWTTRIIATFQNYNLSEARREKLRTGKSLDIHTLRNDRMKKENCAFQMSKFKMLIKSNKHSIYHGYSN